MQNTIQKAVAHAARAPQLFELCFTKKTLSALRCKN